ncbi:hypothetical protein RRG08_039952 [Elysia crispata]|uniref:Uncharacterized protein n=1 Tax=Elysia crispata TaxID=231223 RepID=A0AAE1DBF9_9GAST|nr:hypothetical protein RRG08_039952 [Elysia crispata]
MPVSTTFLIPCLHTTVFWSTGYFLSSFEHADFFGASLHLPCDSRATPMPCTANTVLFVSQCPAGGQTVLGLPNVPLDDWSKLAKLLFFFFSSLRLRGEKNPFWLIIMERGGKLGVWLSVGAGVVTALTNPHTGSEVVTDSDKLALIRFGVRLAVTRCCRLSST